MINYQKLFRTMNIQDFWLSHQKAGGGTLDKCNKVNWVKNFDSQNLKFSQPSSDTLLEIFSFTNFWDHTPYIKMSISDRIFWQTSETFFYIVTWGAVKYDIKLAFFGFVNDQTCQRIMFTLIAVIKITIHRVIIFCNIFYTVAPLQTKCLHLDVAGDVWLLGLFWGYEVIIVWWQPSI